MTSLFRSTSTAVHLCVLLQLATPASRHASEEVRDRFVNFRIQVEYTFESYVLLVCL